MLFSGFFPLFLSIPLSTLASPPPLASLRRRRRRRQASLKQRGDRQCSSFNFFSQSEYEFFPCDCQLNLMLVPNSRVWVLCLGSLRNFGIGSVRKCSREKRNHKCSFWSGLGFFNQLVLLRLDWPILFSFLGDGVTTLTYLCGKLLTFRAGKRQLGKPPEKWL